MRPIVKTLTDAAETGSDPIVTDFYANPYNVGMGVVVDGTVDCKVQHTFDDVLDADVTPTWFDHTSLVGLVASADGNYAFPVRAIRLYMTSGTGTATLTVIQAGMPGRG
jgi:hypothetical protein